MKALRPLVWDAVAILAVAAVFLSLAARHLDLPGPFFDETVEPNYGLAIAQNLPFAGPYVQAPLTLDFSGRRWPLWLPQPYDWSGFVMYYTAAAFRLGGASLQRMRAYEILLGACLLLLFYAFCRLWFPRPVAACASLLLAANPAFVIWSRVCFWALELPVSLFALASLLCFSIWWRRGGRAALYAGFFFWGFLINVSIKALAFWVGFPILYLIFVPRPRRLSSGQAALGLLTAAAAAANFLALNLRHGFFSFFTLLQSLLAPSVGGVHNADLGRNAWVRLGQLRQILSGAAPQAMAGSPCAPDVIFPWLFAASFLLLSIRLVRPGRRPVPRIVGALLVLCAIVAFLTCFSPGNLSDQHLFILWPLPVLISALGIWAAARGRGRRAAAAGAAAFLLALASEARADRSYFAALERTGGSPQWSTAIEDVSSAVDGGKGKLICLDWGLGSELFFLSRGRLVPIEGHNFRRGVDPELLRRYRNWLRDPNNRYLMWPDDFAVLGQRLGYYAGFRRMAAQARRRLVLERAFTDRQGTPVVLLYRAR